MNIVEVTVEFAFEAAHWLPLVPEGHKCRRLHGHSYKVAVTVAGSVQDDGMVTDFANIKQVVKPIIGKLDHSSLNDQHSNPTCENLCIAIWMDIGDQLPGLAAVTVRETDHGYCTYRGATS
jgi:6-pyruvoyltetrahydropterin/6-carboxytetrahydropterin synthase